MVYIMRMRKKFLVVLSLFAVLLSCEISPGYDVEVISDTLKTVEYKYKGINYTLSPTETKIHKWDGIQTEPTDISVAGSNVTSIIMVSKGSSIFIIKDADEYKFHVANSLPVGLTIKADNYIDAGGLTELTVTANGSSTV